MKIVFIAIKGIDVIGGIETYTVELGQRLVKSNHEVVIYCMKSEKKSKPFEYKGMMIIPLPTVRHKYFEKMVLVFLASFHQLTIKNIDIVHYHAVGPSIFSFIPRLFGRYTVFQSHGHEWERDSWNAIAKLFFHTSEKLSFLFSNSASAVSKSLKNYYEERYNKPVEYIPSGITPKLPLPLQINKKFSVKKSSYLLYVGRLSKEKRIHDLISAYNAIKNCSLKLVIVGKERPEDKEYVQQLKTLSSQNSNIIFTGAAYNEALTEWYSNAYAYILPSGMEGLPITLLEAMSFSRCCIASDIAANTEALGGNGITYPVGNIEKLKEKIEYIIENPLITEKLGNALLKRVYNNYTWESITQDFIKYYTKNTTQLNHKHA